MITASVAVEGGGHGLGLPGPYLPAGAAAYHQPPVPPSEWARAAAQPVANKQQEFLRPAPKSHAHHTAAAIVASRYNGTTSLNGSRLLSAKYPTITGPSPGPVNLSQQATPPSAIKDEPISVSLSLPVSPAAVSEELASYYPRLYPPPPPAFYPGPYGGLYPAPYTPLVRPAAAVGYVQPPPLSPLEHQYSPPASTTSPHAPIAASCQGTFISPANTQFASSVVSKQLSSGRDRDRRIVQGFKVPSGKEGSLKHRILTRPSDARSDRKQLPPPTPITPPTPSRTHTSVTPTTIPTTVQTAHNNNTVIPANFSKGSLIQLATGELRRVEDMRTEDFVLSAEKSPELRLAESTVVRVCENGTVATITLSYNQNRTQVEFEASLEHPFFVYGQGWASCNPERTLQYYGLKVHRLQVGDILVSLTPREHLNSHGNHGNHSINSSGHSTTSSSTNSNYDLTRGSNSTSGGTVTTTATTTAMTARQLSRPSITTASASSSMPPPSTVAESAGVRDLNNSNSRKRRWSAPDQICDEQEQVARRVKE